MELPAVHPLPFFVVHRRAPVALVVLLAAAAGCNAANEYVPPPPPAVTVAKPVSREIARELEFTGTTRATEAVDVRARVNGYLQRIEFKDGADVKAGDLLFVIEPAPFEVALDAAKATLQKAQAEHALAEAELNRTKPLVQRGAVSGQELDVKLANVATSLADVASGNAAVRQAELDLGYTQVQSPISGRVSRHLVDVGNLVQAETTVLTRVEAFDPIHAYFSVSDSDVLEFIRLNQESGESIRENPPTLFLGLTNKSFPYEGKLDFAEIGVDPQTGTQLRRGEFPNPDGKLVPGLFVRLRLPIGEPQPKLTVPDRAIATDQRGEYVLVVNDKDIVEYRSVELGIRVDDMRVVGGVSAEDWVVVNGIQRARPGAPVDPQQAEDEADGAPPGDPAVAATAAADGDNPHTASNTAPGK